MCLYVCKCVCAPEHMCYSSYTKNTELVSVSKDAQASFDLLRVCVCPSHACTHSSVSAKVIMFKLCECMFVVG